MLWVSCCRREIFYGMGSGVYALPMEVVREGGDDVRRRRLSGQPRPRGLRGGSPLRGAAPGAPGGIQPHHQQPYGTEGRDRGSGGPQGTLFRDRLHRFALRNRRRDERLAAPLALPELDEEPARAGTQRRPVGKALGAL